MRLSAPLDRLGRRLLQAWEERAIALKAASFAAIGVVNTLVDFGTFLMARELFRSPYFISALGRAAEFCDCSTAEKLALIPANVVAWSVAVSGSYILNTFVTFAVESGRRLSLKAFASFAVSGSTSRSRTSSYSGRANRGRRGRPNKQDRRGTCATTRT